ISPPARRLRYGGAGVFASGCPRRHHRRRGHFADTIGLHPFRCGRGGGADRVSRGGDLRTMNDAMPPESRRLLAAVVDAYPEHVRRRIGDRNVPGLSEAIEEGRTWLEDRLVRLLSIAFSEQRRGPLEVFQEAMRFP